MWKESYIGRRPNVPCGMPPRFGQQAGRQGRRPMHHQKQIPYSSATAAHTAPITALPAAIHRGGVI